jgi:hypothetical protein
MTARIHKRACRGCGWRFSQGKHGYCVRCARDAGVPIAGIVEQERVRVDAHQAKLDALRRGPMKALPPKEVQVGRQLYEVVWPTVFVPED